MQGRLYGMYKASVLYYRADLSMAVRVPGALCAQPKPAVLQSAGLFPAELWCSICVINTAPKR